jgi:hypothetical protein
MDGLYDEPRFGAPPRIGDDEICKALEVHPEGATHWSHFGRALGAEEPFSDRILWFM